MKENKITIIIQAPVSEVFSFTTNPANTPKWIECIVKEETNEWPVKIGSIYKNMDNSGIWNKYILVNIEENKVFELKSEDGNYWVKYTYNQISPNGSTLEYYEGVNNGDIKEPFTKETLEKLKQVIESNK